MSLPSIAGQVATIVAAEGPLTGSQLHERLGGEVFSLWRACRLASDLVLRPVGRRYVRLDRTIEGLARLSPSILREFMTYTIVGAAGDDERIEDSANRLLTRITLISKNKLRLATRIAEETANPLIASGVNAAHFCMLVAGDIVYGMSHDVARREPSTGGLVEGSDLDIIVLLSDDAPPEVADLLDQALIKRKWLYLRSPAFHEEVDYVVKPMARLADQARFDTFQGMVACKVFDEAQLIAGSAELHHQGRALLDAAGVTERLRALEIDAIAHRDARELALLALDEGTLPRPDQVRFYTNEEAAEFEH